MKAKNYAKANVCKTRLERKAGQCYWNAVRAILNVDGYQDADYVEGIAVSEEGSIQEHGWVERAGEIIDPTWLFHRYYFPGLRFAGREGVAKAIMTIPPGHMYWGLPLFYRFGWAGCDSPEFESARQAACQFVEQNHLLGDGRLVPSSFQIRKCI